MVEVNEDPLAWLDQRHPRVEEMDTLERWQRWRAVLDEMDSESAKKKFLPRTEVELDSDYEFRIKTAEFLGGTDSALARISGAVFGTPAKIEVEDPDVEAFVANCDGGGQKLIDFFEGIVSPEAQGMGIGFIGIDKAPKKIDPANKLQERQAGQLKCFATFYAAEEVTNWGFDENGAIDWVIISRMITKQESPSSAIRYFAERRVIDTKEIKIFRKELDKNGKPKNEDEKYAEISSVQHSIGEVPLVPVYGKRHGPFAGWCVVPGSVRADIQRFNLETWHALDLYRHANQLLVIESAREMQELVKGPVFRINPNDSEKIYYVSPGSGTFQANEEAIKRLKMDGREQSGTNPAATSDGANTTTGESGIAQRVRFTHTEKRAIEEHARQMENGIREVLRIVAKYLGTTVEPKVTFYTTFDTSELPELMNTYGKAQFWIDSPTWHRAMLKQIAAKSIPDLDETEKEAISKEIDAQPVKPDPSSDQRTQNLGN
jgi:hypothetical protein